MGFAKKLKKAAKKAKKAVEKTNAIVAKVNSNPLVAAGMTAVGLGGVSAMISKGTSMVDQGIDAYEGYEDQATGLVSDIFSGGKKLTEQVSDGYSSSGVSDAVNQITGSSFSLFNFLKSLFGGR